MNLIFHVYVLNHTFSIDYYSKILRQNIKYEQLKYENMKQKYKILNLKSFLKISQFLKKSQKMIKNVNIHI